MVAGRDHAELTLPPCAQRIMAAPTRLKKSLGLFDVYAISTGAMFSSGFFLLPGIAALETGPSVALAYLVAGVMILPAMFSIAELSTAMPRAGGTYYFLDRAMGPLMGTVGGLGAWWTLILKSAFALVGLGAYLAMFVDVPIEPLAVGLAMLFCVINVVGAKESSGLQRLLVAVLVGVMAVFLASGFVWLAQTPGAMATATERFFPLFTGGIDGFLATVGIVFVSYAGLTKVASVAEEVKDPDRNIPLGMILALITATVVYVAGVGFMVAVIPPQEFVQDLTPVATAGDTLLSWMPGPVGVALIVASAVAAFASTGNAGILAASRYPMAMARDSLLPERFEGIGRFGTPTFAVVTTTAVMIALIVLLDISALAKLASAFNLLLFVLLNACVIVMRESRIDYYRPGYRSPLYPTMQIVGVLVPVWLIAEMGWLAIGFTMLVVVACVAWYFGYARQRVSRGGAIYHVFEQLGRRVSRELDHELRRIVSEKGLQEEDPFEEVVADAVVLDVSGTMPFDRALEQAAAAASARLGLEQDLLLGALRHEVELGLMPVSHGAASPHLRLPGVDSPVLVMLRARAGIEAPLEDTVTGEVASDRVVALLLLVGGQAEPGVHLRMLAQIADRTDDEDFLPSWLRARGEAELKEVLLRDDRFVQIALVEGSPAADLVGKTLPELRFPPGALVALVRRTDDTFVPRLGDVFRLGDRLTVIGQPDAIEAVRARFGRGGDERLRSGGLRLVS